MPIKLYDLCTADREVRPSPFCWLVKFALHHKGLAFETIPLGFVEKDKYPDPDYAKLPVVDDNGDIVRDSMAIIAHLEKKYPEKPLTRSEGESASAAFYGAWLGASLFPALAPLTFIKVHDALDKENKAYFRKTREQRFGMSLEAFSDNPSAPENMTAALSVLAAPLADHDFLGGSQPNLCDYLVFSPLMWRRTVTDETPYDTPPPVTAWSERMLGLYDDYARKAKRAAAA